LVHTSHTTGKCVSIELISTCIHASHKAHWIGLWLLSSHKALQIWHKTSFGLTCFRGLILWRCIIYCVV
jgi:hypothetical protein